MDKYLLVFLNVPVFFLSHFNLLLWFICISYLTLIRFVPVFLLSCSDMWKLLLHTEEMMGCQNSSGPGGRAHLRGRTAGVLGWLFLFVHWKLLSAALWFTKKYLSSLFWPFSALQLEPVMDLGMEELKSSISNSVQVSNRLRVRLRGRVTLCTFPCCCRQSLTCEEPRAGVSWLCCTRLRLLGSFCCLCSFCSCHICAWLQVDPSLKLKLAVAWAASASFS